MVYNRNFDNRSNLPASRIRCSCGSRSKLYSRKNYPFGMKSKPIVSIFYRCISCKKTTFMKMPTQFRK